MPEVLNNVVQYVFTIVQLLFVIVGIIIAGFPLLLTYCKWVSIEVDKDTLVKSWLTFLLVFFVGLFLWLWLKQMGV